MMERQNLFVLQVEDKRSLKLQVLLFHTMNHRSSLVGGGLHPHQIALKLQWLDVGLKILESKL